MVQSTVYGLLRNFGLRAFVEFVSRETESTQPFLKDLDAKVKGKVQRILLH